MLKVENVTKYYGDFKAVDDLSFEVKDGALNKIKDGSKGYYEILELLNDQSVSKFDFEFYRNHWK